MEPIPVSFLECLEAIYRLAQDGAAVSLDSLGRRLGLNKTLVTEKVLGLQGMGLVETNVSDRVLLTPEGRRRGQHERPPPPPAPLVAPSPVT